MNLKTKLQMKLYMKTENALDSHGLPYMSLFFKPTVWQTIPVPQSTFIKIIFTKKSWGLFLIRYMWFSGSSDNRVVFSRWRSRK